MNIKVGSIIRIRDNGTWSSPFVKRIVREQVEFVVLGTQEIRLIDETRFRYKCAVPKSLGNFLGPHDTFPFWDDEVELVRATCPMEDT